MKKKINSELSASILYIIVGLLLVFFPNAALSWAMTIAGALFIISGAVDIWKKNLVGGAISVIIGAAIILFGWLLVSIVLLVFGILIAVKGGAELVEVVRRKKVKIVDVIFPVLTIIVGIVLAFGNAISWLVICTGVFLCIDGVIGVIGHFKK